MPKKLTQRQKDKLIEAAQNAYEYEVAGTGEFPIDMLRYDLAWPATEAAGRQIIFANDRGVRQQQRSVTLRGLKPPTDARWNSFGWSVAGWSEPWS